MKTAIAALSLASVLGAGALVADAQSSDSAERRTGRQMVRVGQAGSVVIHADSGRLRLLATKPAAGWKVVEARATGRRELDVTFRKGGRVMEFEADLVRGRVVTDVAHRGAPRWRALSGDVQTVPAGPAGTVSVQFIGNELQIVDVVANPGWQVTEQRDGRLEVDVTFVSADKRVELEIDVARGELVADLDIETRRGSAVSDGRYEIPAGAAGSLSVEVTAGTVDLVGTDPAAGWTATGDLSRDDDEVEVRFSGAGGVVEASVELDDGRLEVEIESERDDDDDDDD